MSNTCSGVKCIIFTAEIKLESDASKYFDSARSQFFVLLALQVSGTTFPRP